MGCAYNYKFKTKPKKKSFETELQPALIDIGSRLSLTLKLLFKGYFKLSFQVKFHPDFEPQRGEGQTRAIRNNGRRRNFERVALPQDRRERRRQPRRFRRQSHPPRQHRSGDEVERPRSCRHFRLGHSRTNKVSGPSLLVSSSVYLFNRIFL
jgi:hypothetical protein